MRRFILEDPESRLAVWSRRIAVFGLAVIAIALVMLRSGAQNAQGAAALGAGLVLIALALLTALAAFVRIWNRGHTGLHKATQAFLICVAVMILPVTYAVIGALLPQINDVTTDFDDPPAFSRSRAVLTARGNRVPPDPPAEWRALQAKAYDNVQPILLDNTAAEAFERARKTAQAMGWRIIEAVPPGGRTGTGRIEATSTTLLLRFTDDITIRVRARADGSRIDLRSASRIGRHDFGANAKRIVKFTQTLEELGEGG
jgi:uncharacterized protein (DUF1499 family)